jgi:CheY-like chemotaxis protein
MISDAAVRGAQLTRLLLVFGKTGELPELDVARPKSRAAARRQIISPALSTAPGRILLVEDEEINRDLARKVIERAGHRVAAVANGAEAVAAMQREDFDLVLMDTLMPVMDGLTATRKIRQLAGSRSKVPVIAVTGTALADDVAAFAEAGIDDYIAKPFVFSALVAKIDSWLDRRDGRAADIAKACDAAGAASLSELTNMMGRAWVERGLTQLIEQIDELFEREAIAPTDAAWLTSRSHALVSLAGLLGFADLSHCCSVLEEASRGARDLDAPLAKAKIAATLVRGRTAEMLGSR